ncbi:MAG: hypothetical protein CMI32_06020 [Opitutales bacterium]|jgi:YggT family protein|nr:hypothetical protein [Opitutales bacterium]|tara:strand:+ start:200 stop:436 length:237 start_codon:yes stop_codon:yes gene_type:complete
MLRLIDSILGLYSLVLLAYIVLSWLQPNFGHPAAQFLRKIVDPVLIPVRKILPPMGGIDFSVMAVLLVIYFIRSELRG